MRVRKTAFLYGVGSGVLVVALRLLEYRYLVLDHAFAPYRGVVAALSAGLGIWLGLRLTRPPTVIVRAPVRGLEGGAAT